MRAAEFAIQLAIIGPLAIAAVAWAAVVHRQSRRNARRVYHEHHIEDARRRHRADDPSHR